MKNSYLPLDSALTSTEMQSTYIVVAIIIYQAQPSLSAHKSTILNMVLCPHPDPPYEPTGRVVVHAETYKRFNRILFRGNATVNRDSKIRVRLSTGLEINKQLSGFQIDIKGMTCRNTYVKIVLAEFRLPYDANTCTVHKGNYTFDKIDVTRIDSANKAVAARDVGINVWQFSMYGPDGTYFCARLRVRISKA